ncbi:MAG: hypothetical protein NT069_07685 [Planctomycetota bacterium]|nr:hypothetical protein [Planctomycetota bacterium]
MVGNDPNKQTSQYVLTQQELLEFLVSIGILKKTLDPKTGTSSIIDPDTGTGRIAHTTLAARLKGMQFIGKVKHRSYTPKTGKNAGITQQVYEFQYGRGCSLVDAPENADTPMNLDALKAIGRSRFVLPTAPPPSGRQAAQAAHPGQKPAAAAQGAQKPAAAAQQQKPTAAISGLDGI